MGFLNPRDRMEWSRVGRLRKREKYNGIRD
jgi:hypothetical protein